MTNDSFKRAAQIQDELLELRTTKLSFDDSTVIKINGRITNAVGLETCIRNYISQKITELEKEFESL